MCVDMLLKNKNKIAMEVLVWRGVVSCSETC